MASAPTLCRLEKWADRATAWRLHQVLVDQFIASFNSAPEELVRAFGRALHRRADAQRTPGSPGRVRTTRTEGTVRTHRSQAAAVDEFSYAEQSWPHERRVFTRLEWDGQGCKECMRTESCPLLNRLIPHHRKLRRRFKALHPSAQVNIVIRAAHAIHLVRAISQELRHGS